MKKQLLFLTLIIALLFSAYAEAQQRVLFIRGGNGTGGFLESSNGNDEQLSDINDFRTSNGNHSWGQFSNVLRDEGFELEQMIEGPANNNTPINLANMNLSRYEVIVFGSNNADYSTASINALVDYVRDGGSALFISDGNFGRSLSDAPNSDQQFLDRFGWVMRQDNGTYVINRNEFVVGNHPILQSVSSYDGEGVSPIRLNNRNVSGVNSTILTRAEGDVRLNNRSGQGTLQRANNDDASLIVASVGNGRIAGHFDRNTFFNNNGAGTNINRFDNRRFAVNLFNWLADAGGNNNPPANNNAPSVSFTNPSDGDSFNAGVNLGVTVSASDSDGSISNVRLLLDGNLVRQENASPYNWGLDGSNDTSRDPRLSNLSAGTYILEAIATDNDGATTSREITITVGNNNPPPPPAGNQPPSVSFTNPSDGDNFSAGANLGVTVSASDSDGSISNVRLFLDGNLVRQENITPYNWGLDGSNNTNRDPRLSNLSAGTYVLEAIATDNDGATTSREITITVGNNNPPPPTNNSPSVSFTNPSDGDNFSVGTRLGVTVSASDNGSISNVRLFLDGSLVRQENVSPYNWGADNSPNASRDPSLNNLSAGTYALEAIATDNNGNTTSREITITVGNRQSAPQANSSNLADDVIIFPMPIRNGAAATIQVENGNSNVFKTMQIVNIFGQLVEQKPVVMGVGNTMQLNTSGMSAGIYFIKMSGTNGSVTKKIIVQ